MKHEPLKTNGLLAEKMRTCKEQFAREHLQMEMMTRMMLVVVVVVMEKPIVMTMMIAMMFG